MAHLTKEQYSRRNENASNRMVKNAENTALTEEQHESLSNLCTARHKLHSDKRHAVVEDYNGLKKAIVDANVAIYECGLTPMSFVGTDSSDFIDIDSLNEIEYSEDEYDSEYERISNELEKLNSKIEHYLSEIDSKYGTNYAPTGVQRIV